MSRLRRVPSSLISVPTRASGAATDTGGRSREAGRGNVGASLLRSASVARCDATRHHRYGLSSYRSRSAGSVPGWFDPVRPVRLFAPAQPTSGKGMSPACRG
jgi:hypothetical protein